MIPLPSLSAAPTAQEKIRGIREEISFACEDRLRALHSLDARLHAGYALFPALLAAGLLLSASALRGPEPAWPRYAAGVLLAALGMNSCFLLIHEAVHGILFRNPALNRLAGVLLSACGGMAFSAYRFLHLRHHDYLGDPRDPDDYANYARNPRLVWLMHFVRLGLGTVLYVFAIPMVSLRHAGGADRRAILAEYAFLSVVIAALLCLVHPVRILAAWGPPFLLANWMINIRGFSQHGIADASDPWLASRSTVPHPLVRFFLINENFHLEHHLFPGVPGYRLAELHALLRPRIPRRLLCGSYVSFLAAFLRQAPRMDEHPIGLTFQSGRGFDGGGRL